MELTFLCMFSMQILNSRKLIFIYTNIFQCTKKYDIAINNLTDDCEKRNY